MVTVAGDINIAGFQRIIAAADLMLSPFLTYAVSGLSVVSLASHLSTAFSATSKVKNEYHECDDEQDMDEPTGDMERKPAAPKQQKKDSDNQ